MSDYQQDLQKLHDKLVQLMLKSPTDDNKNHFIIGCWNMISPDLWPQQEYIEDIKTVQALFQQLADDTTGERHEKYVDVVKQLDGLLAYESKNS